MNILNLDTDQHSQPKDTKLNTFELKKIPDLISNSPNSKAESKQSLVASKNEDLTIQESLEKTKVFGDTIKEYIVPLRNDDEPIRDKKLLKVRIRLKLIILD